jgi:bacterioferritin
MKGNDKVIEALNRALTIELTAINQYFIQAKMLKNWGYLSLAKKMHEESIGEMKHADKLIERILFLEGIPNIARYDVIRVGTDVVEQLENDLKLETSGVKAYNEAVDLAAKVKDNGTRELLEGILVSSEHGSARDPLASLSQPQNYSRSRDRRGLPAGLRGAPAPRAEPGWRMAGVAAAAGSGAGGDLADRGQAAIADGGDDLRFRDLEAFADELVSHGRGPCVSY